MDALKRAGYDSSDARRERFARDGYLSPVRVMDAAAAEPAFSGAFSRGSARGLPLANNSSARGLPPPNNSSARGYPRKKKQREGATPAKREQRGGGTPRKKHPSP